MRTFIAVGLSEKIIDEIGKFLSNSCLEIKNNKISWVKKENLHITIKFLGEIKENQVETIEKVLSDITRKIKSFEVEIKEIGVFPNINFPRVVWIGIKEQTNTLSFLAKTVEEELHKLGFPKENKEFVAHLTIGRIKKLNNVSEIKSYVEKHKNIDFGKSKIESVTFFQSILHPEGPEYRIIKRFYLGEV